VPRSSSMPRLKSVTLVSVRSFIVITPSDK
jgi:hypothetical protein